MLISKGQKRIFCNSISLSKGFGFIVGFFLCIAPIIGVVWFCPFLLWERLDTPLLTLFCY